MSITDTNVIDMIGTSHEGDETVTLAISDHLDWAEEHLKEHLFLIQEKINTYLRFIESGEINEQFPSAKGKKPVIELIGKYALPSSTDWFFSKIKEGLNAAGYEFRFLHQDLTA